MKHAVDNITRTKLALAGKSMWRHTITVMRISGKACLFVTVIALCGLLGDLLDVNNYRARSIREIYRFVCFLPFTLHVPLLIATTKIWGNKAGRIAGICFLVFIGLAVLSTPSEINYLLSFGIARHRDRPQLIGAATLVQCFWFLFILSWLPPWTAAVAATALEDPAQTKGSKSKASERLARLRVLLCVVGCVLPATVYNNVVVRSSHVQRHLPLASSVPILNQSSRMSKPMTNQHPMAYPTTQSVAASTSLQRKSPDRALESSFARLLSPGDRPDKVKGDSEPHSVSSSSGSSLARNPQVYVSQAGRFRIDFPGEPQYRRLDGSSVVHVFTCEYEQTIYGLGYHDYENEYPIEEDRMEIVAGQKNAFVQICSARTIRESPLNVDGWSGIELHYEGESASGTTYTIRRFVLVGSRMYTFYCGGLKDAVLKEKMHAFLNSFEVIDVTAK